MPRQPRRAETSNTSLSLSLTLPHTFNNSAQLLVCGHQWMPSGIQKMLAFETPFLTKSTSETLGEAFQYLP